MRSEEPTVWGLANRIVKSISDVTFGTVIVLVHVALADRERARTARPADRPHTTAGSS